MKSYTGIEQSKKLIELGIDVNTADMMWDDWSLIDEGWKLSVGYYPEIEKDYGRKCYPSWSLTALLGLIKPINENTYTIRGTLDGGAIISFDEVTSVMFQEEEIIDAVFEMVVWLKEIGKLESYGT